jgi:hypothetical protein
MRFRIRLPISKINILKNIYSSADYQVIVAHVINKLECKKEKWRKILKTLFLIEHLLRTGSPNIVDSMKGELYKIKNLNSFSFIDTNRSDKGETSKNKFNINIIYFYSQRKIKEHCKTFRR